MANGKKTVSLKDDVAWMLDGEVAFTKAQTGVDVSRAQVNEALVREALRMRHATREKRANGGK